MPFPSAVIFILPAPLELLKLIVKARDIAGLVALKPSAYPVVNESIGSVDIYAVTYVGADESATDILPDDNA